MVSHTNRFKLIASGYLILMKDEKILLSRRYQTGYEDGNYSLPAGHLEEHETVRMCCSREAFEEIGLTLPPESLELVHVMHRRQLDERIDFFFLARHWKGEIVNKEPTKCDDLQWFPFSALPSNVVPYVKTAIEQYSRGIIYSEFGWK